MEFKLEDCPIEVIRIVQKLMERYPKTRYIWVRVSDSTSIKKRIKPSDGPGDFIVSIDIISLAKLSKMKVPFKDIPLRINNPMHLINKEVLHKRLVLGE